MSISVSDYRALAQPKKQGRYGGNKRIQTDEGSFDSKGEYARWCILKTFNDRGDITELERQVEFPFEVNGKLICTYRADFTFVVDDRLRVEDFKGGIITPDFVIKYKMMEAFYGIAVQIIKRATADIR